jgi:hypothetical protein
MATTQKIRVVLEVDLTYDEHARSSYPLGTNADAAESAIDTAFAHVLLAALREDPVRYAEFVKTVVVGGIQVFEECRELVGLAGIGCPYTTGLTILQQVIPQLSPEAQAHFQLANQEDWFSESVDTIYNAVKATPTKMSVEYPVT